jgi:hypothetical protein
LTVGLAFSVLGALVLWRQHGSAAAVLFTIGGSLMASGILAPTKLGPVQRLWMGLAHAISRITTPVFMGAVFYLVMTPIGLMRRTVSANSLRHRADKSGYWKRRDPDASSTMERQF